MLFLTNTIKHYRVPILNIIASKYDFTVLYSQKTEKEVIEECNFKTIFSPIKKIGRFIIHKDNIQNITKGFDVVIATNDPTWLSYLGLSLCRKRDYKLIYWNIGVPASYYRKYGEASMLRYLYGNFFEKRADGLIFYSDKAIELRKQKGIFDKKIFIANNTVNIPRISIANSDKEYILFIGTLYLEKGLDVLLESYKAAFDENGNIPHLKIVGGGDQFGQIVTWINENGLNDKIDLLGSIYDENKKASIFAKAIACISPRQAGLAVLESMGYGVPFITMHDAITGGEAFNIINNINGLRLKNESEFKQVILDIYENKNKYLEYGQNAYNYYWSYRRPEDMAKGVIDAIEKS